MLITTVLRSLLLLLLGLWLVHLPLKVLHPALEVRLALLVDSHLEQLFVLLRHPHLATFHFVWLEGRQVAPKAVVVPKDLHALWVQFVLRAHVTVPLVEHLAAAVKVPEHF